ncbi:MAG TPA: hypothetical protein VGB02_01300 [Pyrinomonadaceae bacterium]|jgi:hypothetical protein
MKFPFPALGVVAIKVSIAITIISGVFYGYYCVIYERIGDWQTRGQFGDAFGFLNAFFSALAFSGLIYTISQQNKVIRQSKTEFDEGVRQFKEQQQVQALITLISIYGKRLDEYKAKNKDDLATQTDKKIVDLTKKLEKFLPE